MTPYRCNGKLYDDYYINQAGSGLPVFIGARNQSGYGLGSLLGGMGRMILPLLKSSGKAFLKQGGKALLKEGVNTGAEIASDVLRGKRSFKNSVKHHARDTGARLIQKIVPVIGKATIKRKGIGKKSHSRRVKRRKRTSKRKDIFS